MRRGHQNAGFTIVEILIVIIVIAVLAAVTVVAYSGIQNQASTAQIATNAKQYASALSAYFSLHGSYPPATDSVCLGRGYTNGKCWGAAVDESSSFMDTLEAGSQTGSLPKPTSWNIASGIIFVPTAVGHQYDGVVTPFLAYTVRGSSTRCPYGPIATYVGGQVFTSDKPASGQSAAAAGFFPPQCWVPLVR